MAFKVILNYVKELLPNIGAEFLQHILTVYTVDIRQHINK